MDKKETTLQSPSSTPGSTTRDAEGATPADVHAHVKRGFYEACSNELGSRRAGTIAERQERGIEARTACPLASLADWNPTPNRQDVIALLEEQSASRVPELIPLRYERMSVSAFTFYRGSAIIMAHDLAAQPTTGLEVQCVGDAHIANFGIFLSPTRHLVFDINDFDETAPGPWEWDIKRLAASVEICGRDRGFSKDERRDAVRACAKQYRHAMAHFAELGDLDVWHAHLDVDESLDEFERELDGKKGRSIRRAVEKARTKDSARAADKLAHEEDGRMRFNSQPPELVPIAEIAATEGYASPVELSRALGTLVGTYFESLPADRRFLLGTYTVQDAARKVVGVGSVGTRAWVALLTGKDEHDPLVLQIKEANQSVVERFYRPGSFAHHGERVVQGQRLIQSTSDILLGWTDITAPDGTRRDYYVRQLWNGKGSIDLEEIGPESLENTARLCAWALAHAHARTGDEVAIAAYLDEKHAFEDALWEFSRAYADQNELDYQAFMERYQAGTLFGQ